MKDFKEIAEKCLAGKLSGNFINRRGDIIPSNILHIYDSIKYPYIYLENCIDRNGNYFYNGEKTSEYDIIDFIPDNLREQMKQEQIKIDIPEGKVPVVEQTESGVVITWKEKELTYNDISNRIWEQGTQIGVLTSIVVNENTNKFSKKVEVLRKLTMIRNYFGKPDPKEVLSVGWCISANLSVTSAMPAGFGNVVFLKKEHAEQAIKILGDELKYLFEPW